LPLKCANKSGIPQRGIAATKSEARNPKFETNSNDQNSNDLNKLEKSYAKTFTEFQEIER
jgi:hypothetical protein